MTRTLTTRLAATAMAGALAFGVVACEVEDGELDPIDDPILDDDL